MHEHIERDLIVALRVLRHVTSDDVQPARRRVESPRVDQRRVPRRHLAIAKAAAPREVLVKPPTSAQVLVQDEVVREDVRVDVDVGVDVRAFDVASRRRAHSSGEGGTADCEEIGGEGIRLELDVAH
eukprot:CAMPEP_0201665122 /NCGR_PEP_ID=MMETSP0494-20130426/6377_1 /ASSEMBLY_ACC=CAM_ASM_000839 /TAXON_ID=420259 /ORGANISM="Thalassiosira gravida, Strain GMp14c1" /LENGTH=126 /DNA_ID=CAMNT_0048144023 /DNA_START=714 /DNA_END=1091 /DNA_ORIENTATION=-